MKIQQVLGIDEVGRGCWAGPLVAAAVVLGEPIQGLKDSKLLTKSQRELLAEQIKQTAKYSIGWVSPIEVDEMGLTKAVETAMRRALQPITPGYDAIIIDGNYNYLPEMANVQTLVRADSLIPAVSAASILAKVARDAYMTEQALKFPDYGFDKHVGYGTKAHSTALKNFGVCELHRMSYKPIKVFA